MSCFAKRPHGRRCKRDKTHRLVSRHVTHMAAHTRQQPSAKVSTPAPVRRRLKATRRLRAGDDGVVTGMPSKCWTPWPPSRGLIFLSPPRARQQRYCKGWMPTTCTAMPTATRCPQFAGHPSPSRHARAAVLKSEQCQHQPAKVLPGTFPPHGAQARESAVFSLALVVVYCPSASSRWCWPAPALGGWPIPCSP